MMGGSALSSRALSDAARRELASEWSGPEPATAQAMPPPVRESARRIVVRKP